MHHQQKTNGQQVRKTGSGRPVKNISHSAYINKREREESRSRSRDRNKEQDLNLDLRRSEDSQGQVDESVSDFSTDKNINEEFANLLRVAFIDFFSAVTYSKGFVFTTQERKKLKKEEMRKFKRDPNYKIVHWNSESQWDRDIEMQKIDKIFNQHKVELSQQHLLTLKDVFLKTSYIFADEVTEQLYVLLLTIANISIRETLGRLDQIKSLMENVMEAKTFYKFFSFSFSSYFSVSLETGKKRMVYQTLGLSLMSIFRQRL